MPESLWRNTGRPRRWYSVMPIRSQFGLCQTDMYDKINTINSFHWLVMRRRHVYDKGGIFDDSERFATSTL